MMFFIFFVIVYCIFYIYVCLIGFFFCDDFWMVMGLFIFSFENFYFIIKELLLMIFFLILVVDKYDGWRIRVINN